MSGFNSIIDLIYTTRDKALLENLLIGLTSSNERGEFVQRVEIIKRLIDGQPQHKIAADLGVGVATVTRGSKELALGRFKVLREKR